MKMLKIWSLTISIILIFPSSLLADKLKKFEQPGNYKAESILEPRLRQGVNFKVADLVKSDGYLYLFLVHSNYGDYNIRGLETLKKRVDEFTVLNKLDEFTDSKVFLDAAKEGGINLVTAPIRGIEKLANAASNPDKTWENVKKVPSGVGRFFNDVGSHVKKGVNYIGSKSSKSKKEGEKQDKSKETDLTDEAIDKGTEVALKYVGYSAKESELYRTYEVDQFTTNKPLRDKITRISTVQSAVKIGYKFVPGLGQIQLVSTANSALNNVERLALYKSPEEQKIKNSETLQAMGIEQAEIDSFLGNKNYSPSNQSRIVTTISKLQDVKDPGAFIVAAASIKSPEVALIYVNAATYFFNNNKNLASFERVNNLPLVKTIQGHYISPLRLDILTWTPEVAKAAKTLRSEIPKKNRIFIKISGTYTKRCKSEFDKLNIDLSQDQNI